MLQCTRDPLVLSCREAVNLDCCRLKRPGTIGSGALLCPFRVLLLAKSAMPLRKIQLEGFRNMLRGGDAAAGGWVYLELYISERWRHVAVHELSDILAAQMMSSRAATLFGWVSAGSH